MLGRPVFWTSLLIRDRPTAVARKQATPKMAANCAHSMQFSLLGKGPVFVDTFRKDLMAVVGE